ncbi:MAG: DUF1376 domain-containing protein [Acidobacteria bacterium]|nr:MAG: DUF1376 domain-containing protein [Acidobacteriota bacterium]REK03746.1 MAG: DUF1376 domain-containing protein [Acidobacteriota bacterium]
MGASGARDDHGVPLVCYEEGFRCPGPAYQLYASDFDADTASLDCAAVGAYLRLLNASWKTGPLPADPAKLSRICREETGRFAAIWSELSSFWVEIEHDGCRRLANRRLERVREDRILYHRRQKKAGKASAKKRARAARVPTTVEPRLNHGANQRPAKGQPEGKSPVSDLPSPISDLSSLSEKREPGGASGRQDDPAATGSPSGGGPPEGGTHTRPPTKGRNWAPASELDSEALEREVDFLAQRYVPGKVDLHEAQRELIALRAAGVDISALDIAETFDAYLRSGNWSGKAGQTQFTPLLSRFLRERMYLHPPATTIDDRQGPHTDEETRRRLTEQAERWAADREAKRRRGGGPGEGTASGSLIGPPPDRGPDAQPSRGEAN